MGAAARTCATCGRALESGGQCSVCVTDRLPRVDMDSIDIDIDEDLTTGRGSGERTQVTALPYDLRARYTGRAAALGPLLEAVERARKTRSISFLILIGEPGMGKSSTVLELARTLHQKAPETRCLVGAADGSGVLYAPFARLLSARFGITPSESLDVSRQKIVAGVSEVMPPARVTETAHLVAHLMRIPFPDSPIIGPLAESPQHLEARTFLALRRFVAADAAAGPLVLCFENLEQAEAETVNLLHYLVAGLQGSPVVILGTARESIYDRHPSFGDIDVTPTRIDLGPLTEAEAEGLLRELCRPLEHVPRQLVAHAVRMGRSPRALFELMRFLLESNIIVRGGGASWRVDEAALDDAALPEDHEELVAERVRILPDAERDVLEMASVIGETFWMDGVVALIRVRDDHSPDPDGPTLAEIAAAGDQTRSSAASALLRLIDNEWVTSVSVSSVSGEHEYRFAYPYLWSTVYDSIQTDARREYHRVVAQYLELRPQGRAAMAQEEIARHLELAGDAAGAAARYRRAADFARKSFFNDRAIRLYSQALACLGEADLAARIHLWHDLGSVYELKGDYEAALGGFERMLRLAWVCASRTKAAVAFNKMGRVWRRKGDLKLALEYLERGLELFEQSADLRGIGGSFDDIGSVLYLLGRYDEAYEKVTVGLARRGHGGDKRSIAHSLSNLGNIQKDRGRTEDALTCHQEALEIRRAVGDRAGAITSLNNLAVLAYERGDREDARRGWEQALTEAEEIGALPLQALTLGNLGELALEEDRTEEARRRLDEALEIAQEIDDRQLQVEALRNLALLEHAGGDGPRSRQLAQRAYQVASSAGLRDNEGRALLTLGQVFTGTMQVDDERTVERPRRQGEAPIADAYFARGVELLRQIGNQSELARGLDRYGRYKIEQGDTPGGVAMLREAHGLYGRLGMREAAEVEKLLGAV